MKQIDLDDLPPRVAKTLAMLEAGEELVLVQGGGLVARLTVASLPDPAADPLADVPVEERMAGGGGEQVKAMIEDEF